MLPAAKFATTLRRKNFGSGLPCPPFNLILPPFVIGYTRLSIEHNVKRFILHLLLTGECVGAERRGHLAWSSFDKMPSSLELEMK